MKYCIRDSQGIKVNNLHLKLKSTPFFYGLLWMIFVSVFSTPLNSKAKFLVGLKGHGGFGINMRSELELFEDSDTPALVDYTDSGYKLFGGIGMEYKSDSWYALYTGIMYDYTFFTQSAVSVLGMPAGVIYSHMKRHGVAIPLNFRCYPGSNRKFCFFVGIRFLAALSRIHQERFMTSPSFGIEYQLTNGLILGMHNGCISFGCNFFKS